jgi:hypothetical protein
LVNPELQQVQPSYSVPAELVMRFRQATLWSVLNSKRFLAQFSLTQQIQWVDLAEKIAIERTNEAFLRDPIEDDPAIRPLFESVCKEVGQEVDAWHQQRIEELEQSTPAVADLFRSKRGLYHRHWARIKQILWERHHIEWRSPGEMNPWVTFD